MGSFVVAPVLDNASLERSRELATEGSEPPQPHPRGDPSAKPQQPKDEALSDGADDLGEDMDEGIRASAMPAKTQATAPRGASANTFGEAMWDMGNRLGL